MLLCFVFLVRCFHVTLNSAWVIGALLILNFDVYERAVFNRVGKEYAHASSIYLFGEWTIVLT